MLAAALMAALAAPAHARTGCRTDACRDRVHTKHMRRVVAPHRAWLLRVAQCESTSRWTIYNPPYSGGLQFTQSSWAAVGGRGYPHQHTRLEQMYRAVRLLRLQGPGAWPICGRR